MTFFVFTVAFGSHGHKHHSQQTKHQGLDQTNGELKYQDG
jgi:hypothetical protein